MPCASASLAVWSAAWIAGAAAADDVLDALAPWSDAHDVVAADAGVAAGTDLPTPDHAGSGVAALLVLLRRRGAGGELDARVVLPVAGDVRGLPGPEPLRTAAMTAGECAVFPGASLAVVPSTVADGVLRWTVHVVEDVPHQAHPSLPDAEHDLRTGVRDAATTLASMDVARPRAGVREEIARTIADKPAPDWPETIPQRTLRILQRATEVEAILWVATDDSPGGALSASAIRARTDALRPLFDAVRAARRASIAEMVRVLADQATSS